MGKTNSSRDPGSYRDPSGHVYYLEGRVLRTVMPCATAQYEEVRANKTYNKLCYSGAIASSKELTDAEQKQLPEHFPDATYVLEHQKIPYISYPYEWSFSQLKAAALHHLNIQIKLFADNIVFSDASAYNIQFIGGKPIFIDVLSLRPYKKGEYWQGYSQFCCQFLYPLLLQAKSNLNFNTLYRGNLEGITATELATILPWHKKLGFNMLTHLSVVASLEAKKNTTTTAKKMYDKTLSTAAYLGFLSSLRNWIEKLNPINKHSTWNDYEQTQTYNSEELQHKEKFVTEFVQNTKPDILYDLGCNTASYSILAEKSGAKYVIGYDYDPLSVDIAYHRTQNSNNILPLVMDAANPSPSMGWLQNERPGFIQRANANAFIALAFEHHLCIAKNIPTSDLVDWLASIAPTGVLEFVPKDDPTVQIMLATREDIFPEYNKDSFEQAIRQKFIIEKSTVISQSGRTLYWLTKT